MALLILQVHSIVKGPAQVPVSPWHYSWPNPIALVIVLRPAHLCSQRVESRSWPDVFLTVTSHKRWAGWSCSENTHPPQALLIDHISWKWVEILLSEPWGDNTHSCLCLCLTMMAFCLVRWRVQGWLCSDLKGVGWSAHGFFLFLFQDRIRDTLAHELCHAASWLLNGIHASHGYTWRYYARKCNLAHPELPLVTRFHNYKINYKIYYECTRCKAR